MDADAPRWAWVAVEPGIINISKVLFDSEELAGLHFNRWKAENRPGTALGATVIRFPCDDDSVRSIGLDAPG